MQLRRHALRALAAPPVLIAIAFVALAVLVARPAFAEPAAGRSDRTWDARDVELERERWPLHGEPSRGETWLTLGGFVRAPDTGQREIGVLAVVGAAFDRIAAHEGRTAPARSLHLAALVPDVPARASPDLPVTRAVARRAVTAAWRTAALGVDDARLDAMVSRARWSAALPETRLRAMRVFDDGTSPDSAGTTSTYGAPGKLWLEARLTWRFDHLLYADDEPAIERVRMDRLDARQRIASRVLTLLGQWQRAFTDVRRAPAGSADALDASLRVSEAELALDVVTGGWFGAWAEGALRPDDPRAAASR